MTAAPLAARPGPTRQRVAPQARSPAEAYKPPLLTRVPRPAEGTTVVPLEGEQYGGLTAQQAEWDPAGGRVILTGRAPFLDLTGRAGFREDGSLDGTVKLTARVALLGLRVADCTWQVAGWQPELPLAVPAVVLHGSSVDLDLATLPREASCVPVEGLSITREGTRVTATLPATALPPGQPLSPRLQEAFRGLLGTDLGALVVHPDADLGGEPAFVSSPDLFFAPGRYGLDAPETLHLLDVAVRAALSGLVGPVGAVVPPPPARPPVGPAAPVADTSQVLARPAGPMPEVAPSASAEPDVPASTGTAGIAAPDPAEAIPADGAPADGIPAPAPTPEPPAPVQVLMPEAPTTLTPAAVARGGSVAHGAGAAAHAARDLPSADQNVGDARGAVTEPVSETAARAQDALATALGKRPPPSPQIAALADRIRTAIREHRPEDEDKLLATDPTAEAQHAGATITGSVQGQADTVSGSYQAMSSPPPGTAALTPTPVTPPNPATTGLEVPATSAAPDPIPAPNLSLDADVAATDQRISSSGIDTRVTRAIPDGPFQQARDARGELGQAALTTPGELATQQRQAIDSAQTDMAALQQQAVAALQAARSGTVGTVGEHQRGMVGQEQQTRESVSQRAQGIFETAQRAVDQLLQPLSRTAISRWEAGLTQLSQHFHDALARVKAWIDDRHSGVGGAILSVGDYIGGLPGWVTDAYNRAETEFGDGVADLLLGISSDVNGVVAAAQALITGARRDIDAAFAQMEAEFPDWAVQERARFGGMLDGLSARVTQAQTSFVTDLSSRAVTAVNEAHAEVEARRQEAGGLIGKVVAAIEEFVEDPVRAIINGLLRMVGIPPAAFWALIEKIQQVISDIADDPENFVNNLVEGVKLGFQQFFDNFATHVLKGFWDWLFSGLKTPIPMPRDFSASSLFSFALQLMGITWPRVREILVRHIGPTAVEVIEAAWQLISVLIQRGPDGLVEMIKEQLTPESIVNMILEAAVQYLVETLIQQVIMRVVGLLNPVGAIAQAIELIYQVGAWIFRNAARIFHFIEAVVNGMADVVAGNITGLANKIEQGLAMLIPPVIDFLAGLCHLGGLPDEVAQVITRLQTTVYGVMETVIGFLADRAKALLRRLGIGRGESGAGHDDTELGTTVRFSAAGESHRVFVQMEGSRAELKVASTPQPIPALITRWRNMMKAQPPKPDTPEKRAAAESLLTTLANDSAAADAQASQLVPGFQAAATDPKHPTPPSDAGVVSAENAVASTLDTLFGIFEADEARVQLQQIRDSLPGHGLIRTREVVAYWIANYLDPVKAKPIEGALSSVWTADRFTADTFVPSEVLNANAQHVALLPFFAERNRVGGAESDSFASYALVSRESPVRTPFFHSLGSRFAAQLRTEGVDRLKDGGESDLLTNVRALRYEPAGQPYGRFEPWPGSPISVLVRGVISTGQGPLGAFRAFVEGRKVGTVTFLEFQAELARDSRARTWLAGTLRDITVRQHEWLPVSIGAEVLGHAVAVGLADVRRGMGWISLLQSLRTPTTGVLWNILQQPVIVPGAAPAPPGGLVIDPRGHVGSLSLDRFKLVQDGVTRGTGDFHDALRNFFRANRSLDPAAWVDALLAYLPSIMWTGSNVVIPQEIRNRPIGAFYAMPSGFTGGLTVEQVAAEQQARWEQIRQAFRAAKSNIR